MATQWICLSFPLTRLAFDEFSYTSRPCHPLLVPQSSGVNQRRRPPALLWLNGFPVFKPCHDRLLSRHLWVHHESRAGGPALALENVTTNRHMDTILSSRVTQLNDPLIWSWTSYKTLL